MRKKLLKEQLDQIKIKKTEKDKEKTKKEEETKQKDEAKRKRKHERLLDDMQKLKEEFA